MIDKYILKGHEVIPVDLETWAKWYERADRKVANDTIGEVKVSTVFLGMDHGFGGGPPLLFETMVFGGTLDQEQERYSTWDEAVAGHKAMIDRVSSEEP